MLHSDGMIQPILADFIEIGVDVVHPLEPLPAMEHSRVKAEYGDKLTFLGAIDIVHAMPGSREDVIAEVKKRPKPLSLYIFSKERNIINKILREVSFGGGAVNDAVMHLTNTYMGFGGVGDSGMGSYHGVHGFNTFSHFKSILDRSTLLEPNLKYYPHTRNKLKLIKMILGQ